MSKKQRNKKKKAVGSKLVNRLKAKKQSQSIDPRQTLDLASRHHQAGNLQQAQQLYQQVLSVDTQNIIAIYSLGIIAHQNGNLKRGIQLLTKAIAIKPDFADGHNFLGILYDTNSDFESAARSYQKVIALTPDYHEAYNNLGSAYFKLGNLDAAIKNFKQAISLKKDFALAYNNLGNAYKNSGELENAISSYREALAIDPKYIEAHCNLGKALRDYGHFKQAMKSYHNALSVDPGHAEAHRNISKMRKYALGDDHITVMKSFYDQHNISDTQRMHLAFALAKAHEDCTEHARSFEYLLTANRLKRNSIGYATDETTKLNDTIKRALASVVEKQQTISGSPDKTPVFILGMPRSGTSLVEQTLASHPDVFGAGELNDLKDIFFKLTDTNQLEKSFQTLANKPRRILPQLGERYLAKLRTYSSDATYITDKMPHNFQLIGLIRLALPGAKIIHCMRDPMDNCYSIYKNYFAGEHNYAYDLKELGEYYLLYRELMQYWHTLFPGSIYDISYEKLVADQEGETRRLLRYCELPWDDACLSYYKTARRVETASASQVRKPIYKDSVHLWKRYEKQLLPLSQTLADNV